MTIGFLAGTLGQLIVMAVAGWAVSDLVLRRVRRGAGEGTFFEWPERALAAVAGFVAFSVALMMLHVVTGGAVFGVPAVVPVVVGVLVVAALPRVAPPRGVPWLAVLAFVLAVGAVFVLPDLKTGPGARTGDPPWHLGWTEQLLHGEAVPTGPAPEHGRNAYPWGLHSVMATMTRAVPGTNPLVALEALHFLLVLALPLTAACLARRIRRYAGWGAAMAMSLIGGWGWLSARGAAFITSPTDARYGADLVVASPNSVYELLAPSLPRELGLVLLGAFGLFLAHALETHSDRWRVLAGATAGLVGLMSVPMFISALTWMAAAIVIARRGEHVRTAWMVALVAFGVFGLWLGPVLVDYVSFGGFVDITPQLGKEWALITSLGSWGLLVPFAALGVVVAVRDARSRVILGFGIATALFLCLALARRAFEWELAGNATLFHQGRVWPPAHLVGAALAGVAAAAIFRKAWQRRRTVALAGAAVALAVGAASPVLASMRLTEILDRNEAGFIYGRADMAEGSFVRVVAASLGPDDVVAVRGSPALAFHLFEFSGCRLAVYDDPRLDGNDLRIRYAERAAAWDRAMASGGFEADYEVVPASDAELPQMTGMFEGTRWALVRTL